MKQIAPSEPLVEKQASTIDSLVRMLEQQVSLLREQLGEMRLERDGLLRERNKLIRELAEVTTTMMNSERRAARTQTGPVLFSEGLPRFYTERALQSLHR